MKQLNLKNLLNLLLIPNTYWIVKRGKINLPKVNQIKSKT